MRQFVFRVAALSAFSIVLTGCSLKRPESGLDINSSPSSKVFVDGQEIGSTPITTSGKSGNATVRLVPENKPAWESRVKLVPGSKTIVRQEFGSSEIESAGEVYYFEKGARGKASFAVVSSPIAVTLKIDGQAQGFTPLQIDSLSEGEHLIVLSSPGYKDRAVSVNTVNGKKLALNVKLAQEFLVPTPTPTPVGTITPTPKTSPTPTKKISGSPTPKSSTPGLTLPAKPYVEITETPTKFLNVRSDAGTGYSVVAQVYPSEKYPYISSKTAPDGIIWYQIEYSSGKKGFVISSYAKKIE